MDDNTSEDAEEETTATESSTTGYDASFSSSLSSSVVSLMAQQPGERSSTLKRNPSKVKWARLWYRFQQQQQNVRRMTASSSSSSSRARAVKDTEEDSTEESSSTSSSPEQQQQYVQMQQQLQDSIDQRDFLFKELEAWRGRYENVKDRHRRTRLQLEEVQFQFDQLLEAHQYLVEDENDGEKTSKVSVDSPDEESKRITKELQNLKEQLDMAESKYQTQVDETQRWKAKVVSLEDQVRQLQNENNILLQEKATRKSASKKKKGEFTSQRVIDDFQSQIQILLS